MTRIDDIRQLAAIVSQSLEAAGIAATLSGGGAVSIYSDDQYQSADLDFITSVRNERIAEVLKPLGFGYERGRREFYHPESDFYVEFPSGPLAFGETVVPEADATVIQTDYGPIRIITPTQAVMDRLLPFIHWNDPQSFEQAAMVACRHDIDWDELEAWAEREGVPEGMLDRLRRRVDSR